MTLVLVALSGPASAQHLALHAGPRLGSFQVEDDALRPLEWAGPTAAVVTGTRYVQDTAHYAAELQFGAGPIYNRFSHFGVLLDYGAHISAETLIASRPWCDIYLGAAYRFETLNAYYADWDDSFMYWHVSHTLAPRLSLVRKSVGRITTELNVELPGLGVVSRAPAYRVYKTDPLTYPSRWLSHTHQDLHLAHPGVAYYPTVSGRHTWWLDQSWGLRGSYELRYRNTSIGAGYAALAHTLSLEWYRAY